MDKLKVAILGGGNGAYAMAGHLGMKGFPIRVYNKFKEEIRPIQDQGGVWLEGAVEGFGPVELATTDPDAVIGWADVIMIVVPAFVHRFMAEICSCRLREGQIVVLNPGRTGGALEFSNTLKQSGRETGAIIAEAESLIYACRITNPGHVRVNGIKKRVSLAAYPASGTDAVIAAVRNLYPQFNPAANILVTSFDNIGAVFHPSTVVLNANRIEAGKDFDFYRGMTPTITHFLEAVDRERLAVARAFGVGLPSAREWLINTYDGVQGDTLYERIQSNHAYEGLKAPKSLNVRYILEDVPTGLVPFASFGELAGVPTPACRAIVDICCILFDRDFWKEGRTVKNLGLDGMSVEEITNLVNVGTSKHRR